jgi:hypothetical protein
LNRYIKIAYEESEKEIILEKIAERERQKEKTIQRIRMRWRKREIEHCIKR